MTEELDREVQALQVGPRRVLLACAAYPPNVRGGGPESASLIAKGLASRGHTVRVVTVGDEYSTRKEDGVEIHQISSPNIYWNYWKYNSPIKKIIWHFFENFNPLAYLRIKKEILDFSPEVMMTVSIENINIASWLAAKRFGIPTIHVLHSYFLLCWRGSMFTKAGSCASWCNLCKATSIGKRWMTRYVDWVVGETNFIVDEHISRGLFQKSGRKVIPGPMLAPTSNVRSAKNWPELRVGFLGAFERVKGLESLAAVARNLHDRPQIRFFIGGDGKDKSYNKQVRENFPAENTTILGWVKPSDFFQQIDVLVVPSTWREPFGRVSVEAFYHGVPVIAARSGGLQENIIEDFNGLTFSPGDLDDMERLILKLEGNRNLLKRLTSNAPNRLEQYSFEFVAGEFELIIELALSNSA